MSRDSGYSKKICATVLMSVMSVLKNVKNIPIWNTANCVLKHAEDVLKNVVKWLVESIKLDSFD
jgi:hypothetical protein